MASEERASERARASSANTSLDSSQLIRSNNSRYGNPFHVESAARREVEPTH